MQLDLDAPSNDLIAMNLTIAAVDRWLENASASSGQEVGREIGAMYREIHAVLEQVSPSDDDDEDDDDDEESARASLALAG